MEACPSRVGLTRRRRPERTERTLFLLLICLHLVPVWGLLYFPSQDGPSHIENANLLVEYHHPDRPLLRRYYEFNSQVKPNWVGHLLLAGLMRFVGANTAEKILLTFYVILLPVGVRYAVCSVRADAGFLSFLAFPFIFNFLVHMGFYNFSLSVAGFFLVVGYWIRHQDVAALKHAVVLAILLLALYFCHVVSFVTACLGVAVQSSWQIVYRSLRRDPGGRLNAQAWGRMLSRYLGIPFVAFLPSGLLMMTFLRGQGVQGTDRWSLWELTKHLGSLASLWSYERRELLPSTLLVLLFLALGIPRLASRVRERGWRPEDGLLWTVIFFLVVYYLAPDSMSGGNYLSPRLVLYPYFGLLLWLASHSYRRPARRRVIGLATAISIGLLGCYAKRYEVLEDGLQEYLSCAGLLESNKTLLPLSFSQKGLGEDGRELSGRVRPFLFCAGRIAADRGIVDLHNYEARTRYFPIVYRPGLNPFVHIWRNKSLYKRPDVAFSTYGKRTGGTVDYVLLWGLRDDQRGTPEVRMVFSQLEKGYERIYVSKRGWLELYRRK